MYCCRRRLASHCTAIVLLILLTNVTAVSAQRAKLDTRWRIFGPLPLSGVGADPLSAIPGSLVQVLKEIDRFPSETALGGYATWNTTFTNTSTGAAYAYFNGSSPPLTAWAIGSLHVQESLSSEDNVTFVLMQCSHRTYITSKSSLSVEPKQHHCLGDLVPCPLSLASDEYAIRMSLTSGAREIPFGCVINPNITSPMLIPTDQGSTKPSIIRHQSQLILAGAHASVAVLNADEDAWAIAGAVSVTSSPKGVELTSLSPHPPRLAPGQKRAVRLDLDISKVSPLDLNVGDTLNVTVALSYNVNDQTRITKYQLNIDVLRWPPPSYTATYIDADNSVQAVALRPPTGSCTDKCSVLLATHGAGVDALKNAWTDSFQTQRNAWVVLPTGRRKFGENWEGAQMESALKCLESVRLVLPGVPDVYREAYAIRQDYAFVVGHSMGGHGALTLSTHFPDLLVASMPIAGWLRYDTYGQVGPAFHPQLSFADAGLRGLFALSSEEYADDLYSENIVGVPLTARVGSADTTVPPQNLRKFCRLVREYELFYNINQTLVDLNEVPGKGHWFGGVMDDEQLQPFIAKALIAHMKPELPQQFSVVTQNPGTTGSRGGLRIMVLQVPFQTARLTVRIEGNTWHVTTRNVFRIRYRTVNGVYPRPKRLIIDETTPALQIPKAIRDYNGTSTTYVDLCAVENEFSSRVSWKHCSEPTFPSTKGWSMRGPDNSGPLTQVLGARRVAVIYPTGSKALLGIATRYANVLYDEGISVSVTADASAASTIGEGMYNVIVLGGVGTNKAAGLLQKISRERTARTRKGKICIGSRCTKRPGTGVAFLTPGKLRTLAVVLAGTDDDGLMAATSFLPLSPDQKVPEWVLVNAKDGFGWRGYGAVEAAGYWNRNWQVEPALTYPATWAIDATRKVTVRDKPISKRAAFIIVLLVVIVGIGFLLISMRKAKRKEEESEEREAFIPGELPQTNR